MSLRPQQEPKSKLTRRRSLAAYGIDPSTAVVEQAPEDGLVEEEDVVDEDDDSSDEYDDDVKLVLTGPANRVDLRSVNFSEE